jgi:hypothetical protein
LDDLRGPTLIHGPDNHVQYCRKIAATDDMPDR